MEQLRKWPKYGADAIPYCPHCLALFGALPPESYLPRPRNRNVIAQSLKFSKGVSDEKAFLSLPKKKKNGLTMKIKKLGVGNFYQVEPWEDPSPCQPEAKEADRVTSVVKTTGDQGSATPEGAVMVVASKLSLEPYYVTSTLDKFVFQSWRMQLTHQQRCMSAKTTDGSKDMRQIRPWSQGSSTFAVVSQQTMLERLEALAGTLGLIYTASGASGDHVFLSGEMYLVEIALDKAGGVRDVKINHQGEAAVRIYSSPHPFFTDPSYPIRTSLFNDDHNFQTLLKPLEY